MNLADECSAIGRKVMQARPLRSFALQGRIGCLIERYLFNVTDPVAAVLPMPVVVVQFGGKKISSLDEGSSLISYASATTVLPEAVESLWQLQGTTDVAIIYFEGPALKRIRHYMAARKQAVALDDMLCGALLRQLLALLMEEDGGPSRARRQHCQALLNALLHQLCHQLDLHHKKAVINSQSSKFLHVQTAVDYIQDHLGERLTAPEVAAQSGLQQSYFRQIFQQTTGLTLHRYIMRLRLERARDLLGNSEMPLAAIAEEVGFSNQSHMTSCFQRHYDVTPGLLRRQRREEYKRPHQMD
jgi:AraC family transcriptional regulator